MPARQCADAAQVDRQPKQLKECLGWVHLTLAAWRARHRAGEVSTRQQKDTGQDIGTGSGPTRRPPWLTNINLPSQLHWSFALVLQQLGASSIPHDLFFFFWPRGQNQLFVPSVSLEWGRVMEHSKQAARIKWASTLW